MDSLSSHTNGDIQNIVAARSPGQFEDGIHKAFAGRTNSADEAGVIDHNEDDILPAFVDPDSSGQGDHRDRASPGHEHHETRPAVSELIDLIQMQWRMRQSWLKAEVALTLQVKAWCRRAAHQGDKKEADVIYAAMFCKGEHPAAHDALSATFPLIDARTGIEEKRKIIEKELAKLAKKLPVSPYVATVKGFSINGLVAIVGEAGDIGMYRSPAALWKRMGLAPRDGKAASTWRRTGGLTAEDWSDYGYNPRRRSVMFVVGQSLIGAMGHGPRPLAGEDIAYREDWSPLQKLFVERLRIEAAKDSEMRLKDTKEGKESYKAHASNRAQRFVEKRFLKELWQAWRSA